MTGLWLQTHLREHTKVDKLTPNLEIYSKKEFLYSYEQYNINTNIVDTASPIF